MVPIRTRLDNDDHYEGGNVVKYIVLHATGNQTDSDEGNANYFCTGARGASAHDFVDDDSITQVVLDKNCSWHCGDGKNAYGINNRNSIGIEMCETNWQISAATTNNTIDLVKLKMVEHGVPIENVVRHYDASRKSCPEPWMPNNWALWYAFKERLARAVNGEWVQGWNQNSKGWWYSPDPENKTYYENSWKEINNEWYNFDSEGYARCACWFKDKDKWYYLRDTCKMARTQWLWIDGECYCFRPDGSLFMNCTTPEGYKVDDSGAWIN